VFLASVFSPLAFYTITQIIIIIIIIITHFYTTVQNCNFRDGSVSKNRNSTFEKIEVAAYFDHYRRP